jgi:hypothetical protein
MKLRIRDNTLRFRVNQSEVEALRIGTAVQAVTRFPEGTSFTYRLEPSQARTLSSRFENGTVVVEVPRALIEPWASGAEEGFSGQQAVDGTEPLRITVEKDFACLKPRDPAEDRDAFPHPRSAC